MKRILLSAPTRLNTERGLCRSGGVLARQTAGAVLSFASARFLLVFVLTCLSPVPSLFAQSKNETNPEDRMSELLDANETLYLDALRAVHEKRFGDAENLLQMLLKQAPLHGGAYLDLAILYCELGNQAEADRLITLMKASLPLAPEQIKKLDRLRPSDCRNTRKAWQVMLNADVGWDSNINQGAANPYFTFNNGTQQVSLELLPEFQARSDQYRSLLFTGSYGFNRDRSHLFAQWRLRSYAHLNTFNNANLILGLDHALSDNQDWGHINLAVSGLELGGHLYQKQSFISWRAPIWKPSRENQFLISTGVQNSSYPTQTNFSARTNDIRLIFQSNSILGINASIGYAQDKAKYKRQGGDRTGWNAQIGGRHQYNDAWLFEVTWNWQQWQSEVVYSPGLIDIKRNQSTQQVRVAANYQLTPNQNLVFETRASRNRENIPILEYNARQFQVTWQWQY